MILNISIYTFLLNKLIFNVSLKINSKSRQAWSRPKYCKNCKPSLKREYESRLQTLLKEVSIN